MVGIPSLAPAPTIDFFLLSQLICGGHLGSTLPLLPRDQFPDVFDVFQWGI